MAHEFEALKTLMQSDPEYAWAWHCNLAMPVMDATGCSHEKANQAGAHLMSFLWDVDITKDTRFEYEKTASQSYHEFRLAVDREEDIALAANHLWTEAERTHAANHAARNG